MSHNFEKVTLKYVITLAERLAETYKRSQDVKVCYDGESVKVSTEILRSPITISPIPQEDAVIHIRDFLLSVACSYSRNPERFKARVLKGLLDDSALEGFQKTEISKSVLNCLYYFQNTLRV